MIEIPNLAELDITREQWIEVCQLAYFKEVENEKIVDRTKDCCATTSLGCSV